MSQQVSIKMKILRLILMALPLFYSPARISAQEALQEVTVNPGDTMWNIANKYLKDPQKWPEIVRVNNLPTSDPTIALPGSKIKIPIELIKDEYRTAQLVQKVSDVRYKRKAEQEFKNATLNMTLHYEDSLRTMKDSQARVKFTSKEVIQINENSYVVLKPEKLMQEVQLLKGEVKASKAKVIMPGGTVVNPKGKNSEYHARVREDDTEVVFVYKGEVNVTAKGKTVLVKEGFGTQVPKFSAPIEPQPLANFKDFNPEDLKTTSAGNAAIPPGNKPITFTPPVMPKESAPTPGKTKSVMADNIVGNYHLQISKDERFQTIVNEFTAKTDQPFDIKKLSIPDASYYMRVAFLDALGTQGPYSIPTRIVKDTVPPGLSIAQPSDGFQATGKETFCDVSGTARGAVLVSINGSVVFLGDKGSFSGLVSLKEGNNQIRILARDANGNETIVTRRVTYSKK